MLTTGSVEIARRTAKAAFFGALKDAAGNKKFIYPTVTSEMTSDQDQETYPWLGQVPQLREWFGLRDIKGLPAQDFTIANRKWEATIGVDNDLIRRDKLGQIATRARDMAKRTISHKERLFWDTILLGETALCYDSQFFFDTDHADPGAVYSASQSNLIGASATTPAAPTPAEFEDAFEAGINALRDLRDDQGEPWNLDEDLHVGIPTNMTRSAGTVLGTNSNQSPADSTGVDGSFRGEAMVHVSSFIRARQTALGLTVGTAFWIFNAAPEVNPVIFQKEREAEFETLGKGSDHSFKTDETLYGVNGSYNMGYGPWQHAVKVTFT